MSVVSPDAASDFDSLYIEDGDKKVLSAKDVSQGLAPEKGDVSEETPVLTIEDEADRPYFIWKYERRGYDLSKKYPVATFELKGFNLFLNYDFSANSVVLKNSSKPAWIVTRYSEGKNMYKISPFTDKHKFLTYVGKGKQVTIAAESKDVSSQVWTIETYQKGGAVIN